MRISKGARETDVDNVQRRAADAVPGKRTLTDALTSTDAPVQQRASAVPAPGPLVERDHRALFGPVQRVASAGEADPAHVHASAQRGIASPSSALPYADTIQRAFGRHDISGIQAHTGGDAAASARDMGAAAYATGSHVVLGASPDLHTVAHEAAHVVQQRAGVHLKGGVGKVGDTYEQHADAVADAVVQGRSAEGMLSQMVGEPGHAASASQAGSVQRKAEDYRGGAELEYRAGKAELEFKNLPTYMEENEIKKMIRAGIKGTPIAAINEMSSKGENWALTVETSRPELEGNKLHIELELILGGPKGSTLSELLVAADEAAAAVEALETKAELTLGKIGQQIFDNVANKKAKKANAVAEIERARSPQTASNAQDAQSPNDAHATSEAQSTSGQTLSAEEQRNAWAGLEVLGTWDPRTAKPHEADWGLQVTLGIPLSKLEAAGQALAASGLTDTSVAKPKKSEEVTWSGVDILKKMPGQATGGEATQTPASAEPFPERFNRLMGRPPEEKDFGSEETMDEFYRLAEAEQAPVAQPTPEAALGAGAPSMGLLDGLAKVLAAYVRGTNGFDGHGPKHGMQFVNKNPLPAIIHSITPDMDEEGRRRLRDVCVDLVAENREGQSFNWVGKSLTLAEWRDTMKLQNIDLVPLYDTAYRSSQIGGLSSLNPLAPGDDSATAPIIEFRDLGAKKPSQMRDVLQGIIDKLNASSGTTSQE